MVRFYVYVHASVYVSNLRKLASVWWSWKSAIQVKQIAKRPVAFVCASVPTLTTSTPSLMSYPPPSKAIPSCVPLPPPGHNPQGHNLSLQAITSLGLWATTPQAIITPWAVTPPWATTAPLPQGYYPSTWDAPLGQYPPPPRNDPFPHPGHSIPTHLSHCPFLGHNHTGNISNIQNPIPPHVALWAVDLKALIFADLSHFLSYPDFLLGKKQLQELAVI